MRARFVSIHPVSEKTNELIQVTALCEDATGRMWIGTQDSGLFYFSGDRMTPYLANQKLLDNTINSIAEDGAGNLWLGTPSGLSLLEKGRLKKFTTKDGLPGDFVSNVHVARSGTVWITTRSGMCQFKDGQINPFPFQTDSPSRNPESLGVYEDRTGNLWAFGDTYLVNLTEGKHLNHFGGGDNLSSMRIWSLCEGRRGELWIGTSGKRLYRFADRKFSPVSLRNGGLNNDVRALCEDREGNLWLGTHGGGLVRLQPNNVRVLDSSVGLLNRPVVCLGLGPQDRAWIGFDRGGIYAGTAARFDHVTGEAGMDLQILVSSIAIAPDSRVWVGTPGSGVYCLANQRVVHYGTADGLSDNMVLSVAVDDAMATWVGTASGGLNCITDDTVTRFGTDAGLLDQPITAILPAPQGVLWLGYANGAVVRGEAGKFKTIVQPAVLGGKAIRALHQDSAGRTWAGAAGGRLACITGEICLDWDLSLALAEADLLGILSDADGDLWLGTGKAIYRAGSADILAALGGRGRLRCQPVYEANFKADSAPSYGWPGAARSSDGKLWFGMAGGLVTLDPRRLVVDQTPLPALIENVVVNGVAWQHDTVKLSGAATNGLTKALRFPSDLRSLNVQYTALNFSEPEKIRFRHRLDGSDLDWVDGGAERSIHYGHLPFGAYTFRVQAGRRAGVWDENGAAFSFLVPIPVWRTEWALAFYVVFALTLVVGLVRVVSHRRLRRRLAILAQEQAMERERMRIAKDMHDDIGSKLTKISYMSERAKGELQGQEPVARKLNSIANTSRDLLQSLDEIVWAVNPHNDTLEHLAAYLGHYATEYLQNTGVDCELHIPPRLPHHPLSAEARHNLFLAFEESLNNALKHGRATRIGVHMHVEPRQFQIKLVDNGCGFDANSIISAKDGSLPPMGGRIGNGMKNLQERLAGVGGQCHVRSQPGQGTTVSLTVPLVPARARLHPNEV